MNNIFKKLKRARRAKKEIKELEDKYIIVLSLAKEMICAYQLYTGRTVECVGDKTLAEFKYYTDLLRYCIMRGDSEYTIKSIKDDLKTDMYVELCSMLNVECKL